MASMLARIIISRACFIVLENHSFTASSASTNFTFSSSSNVGRFHDPIMASMLARRSGEQFVGVVPDLRNFFRFHDPIMASMLARRSGEQFVGVVPDLRNFLLSRSQHLIS
ncbi:hypothetical protein QE152_g306 [Popillia japonica]|uniref:Uncharacterized protein n=1 Tax=Popillia japonica TaxID=7064 RepID=A0AAW1NCE9_POPJA